MACLAMMMLTAARHRAVSPSPAAITISRSLIITDPAMLQGFGFDRVIGALVAHSSTTPLTFYRQWFDTQNPKPGLAVSDAPHCDDFITDGKPSFNGFPRRCPTAEGVLATTDPFLARDYTPIAIANRFDLAPADGSNCGQYRIIFAKTTVRSGDKLHVIFEPVLPNPNPSAGLEGCRNIAQEWADFSTIDSIEERRARLEQFFFDGALDPSHFVTGGIRTLQLANGTARYYQFHLQTKGTRILVVPGVLENTPSASLVNTPGFRDFFVAEEEALTVPDVNAVSVHLPDAYLVVESDSTLASGPLPQPFSGARDALGRLDFLGCTGCHTGGGGLPVALPMGAHVDLDQQVSPALRDVFAPYRLRVLTDFLAGKPH